MKTDLRILTKMAMCVSLICVSAYIAFPLPFTPTMVTAQTLALSLTAYILRPRETFSVISIYILIGAVGLPVFSGGSAGIGRLISPTGGFILAWLLAFPLLSLTKGSVPKFKNYLLPNLLIVVPITYIGGMISMTIQMDVTILQAASMSIFPFVPGDILKSVAAAFLGTRINLIKGFGEKTSNFSRNKN